MTTPRTLFEKIWDAHLVGPPTADTPAMLYIDLHLIHEVTSPQAFTWLRERGLKVRRPERTVATMDHSTPTTPRGKDGKIPILDNAGGRAARASSRRTAATSASSCSRWAARGRASSTSSGRSWA